MSGDPTQTPSLSDDEQQLAEFSAALQAAVLDAIPAWMARTIGERARNAGLTLDRTQHARIDDVAVELVADLAPRLDRLLSADVDEGAGSPLALLRSANGPLNDLLNEFGVPAPTRDEFTATHFADDRHDVGPAAFADIDQSVHEPGLMWGAARAHVHLRRRRESHGDGS